MIVNRAACRSAKACITFGVVLILSGCRGPLAPTPGFGDEVRANRDAMVANPDAGVENTELAEGTPGPTAAGILENYHRNEKAQTQEQRQKATKQDSLKF